MERGMDHKYYYHTWTHRCIYAHQQTRSKGKSNQRMSPVTASEPSDTFSGQINRTRQATGQPVTLRPLLSSASATWMGGYRPKHDWYCHLQAHTCCQPQNVCVCAWNEQRPEPKGRPDRSDAPWNFWCRRAFVLRRARWGEWNEDTDRQNDSTIFCSSRLPLFSVRFTGPLSRLAPSSSAIKALRPKSRSTNFPHPEILSFFLLPCLSKVLKPSVRFGAFDWGWDGAGILDVQMCAIYYEGQECFYRFFCVFCWLYAFFAKLV